MKGFTLLIVTESEYFCRRNLIVFLTPLPVVAAPTWHKSSSWVEKAHKRRCTLHKAVSMGPSFSIAGNNTWASKMMQKTEKWLKPWHMGTHLRVLIESYPMNTNMTRFRWFWQVFASWHKSSSWVKRANKRRCISHKAVSMGLSFSIAGIDTWASPRRRDVARCNYLSSRSGDLLLQPNSFSQRNLSPTAAPNEYLWGFKAMLTEHNYLPTCLCLPAECLGANYLITGNTFFTENGYLSFYVEKMSFGVSDC